MEKPHDQIVQSARPIKTRHSRHRRRLRDRRSNSAFGVAQAAKYRRWDISDPNMPPRVLDSYKKGIREMLRRPPTDPRNWYRNAFTHVFDCPHRNWWFLAWHRGYIGWLEQTIREFSGDMEFALPYWDWTKTPRIPAAMFDDVLDPGNTAFIPTFGQFQTTFSGALGSLWQSFSQAQLNTLNERGFGSPTDFWNAANPVQPPASDGSPQHGMFYDQSEARDLTAADPGFDPGTQVDVSIQTIENALRTPSFAGSAGGMDDPGFDSAQAPDHNIGTREGILESMPHDNVHGVIGGFMGQFLSPVDPIFFLHHANLDRLWDVWTRRQNSLGNPTLPQGADLTTWSNEQFLFFTDAGGRPVTKTSPSDYATTSSFDYDYSPGGSGEALAQSTVAVAGVAAPRRVVTARMDSRSGGVAEVPSVGLGTAAPQSPPQTAQITLDLMPSDQGRRFNVLMSADGGAPVVAGGITVFGHAHGPTVFTVPIPSNVGAGAVAAANVPLNIRIVPLVQTRALTARLGAPAAPRVSAITVTTN
jgi:hypothetical protein